MSSDNSRLPRKWFAIAAGFALLIGAIPLAALLMQAPGEWEKPSRDLPLTSLSTESAGQPNAQAAADGIPPGIITGKLDGTDIPGEPSTSIPDPRTAERKKTGNGPPSEDGKRAATPATSGASPPEGDTSDADSGPPPASLRQRAGDGRQVPWGGTLQGNSVRLEVVERDAKRFGDFEIFLARNDERATAVKRSGDGALLRDLAPGAYRWTVRLQGKGANSPAVLIPPRSDPRAADFNVPPPVLSLTELYQTQLDGRPIGVDLRVETGAMLGGRTNFPNAVLEVEAKPTGQAFDGNAGQRIPFNEGSATARFVAADGPYRWRARAVGPLGEVSDWRDFATGSSSDFIIYREPKNVPAAGTQGKGKGSGAGEQGKGRSDDLISPGLGSGHSEPLPSIVRPLPDLWQIALTRIGLGLGVALLVFGAAFGALRYAQIRTRRRA